MDAVFYSFCEFVRTAGSGTFAASVIIVGLAAGGALLVIHKSNPATAIVPVSISLLLSLVALLCS